MRRLSRTAALLFAPLVAACTVDRGGAGPDLSASAGSGPSVGSQSGGAGGNAGASVGTGISGGSAGVFGVGMGNAGGGSGDGDGHEAGPSPAGSGGAVDPVDSGPLAEESSAPMEASTTPDTGSVFDCAMHGGQTFKPNGAASAHCYWRREQRSDWQAAVDACAGEGGHLATLGSSGENNFVVKLFTGLASDDRIWLAGTDKKNDTDNSGGGPYQWITGEPFSYAPWAQGNPDGNCTNTCGGRDCECQHRVCVDRDGIFWDRWENEEYYVVCEAEP